MVIWIRPQVILDMPTSTTAYNKRLKINTY